MPVRIPTQVYYNRRASLPAQPRRAWGRDGDPCPQVASQVFYNQAWTGPESSSGQSQHHQPPGHGRRTSTDGGGRRVSVEHHHPSGSGTGHAGHSGGGSHHRHRRRSSSSQNARASAAAATAAAAAAASGLVLSDLGPQAHYQFLQQHGLLPHQQGGGRYHPQQGPQGGPNLVYLRRSSYAHPPNPRTHDMLAGRGDPSFGRGADQMTHEQWLALQSFRRPVTPAANIPYVRRASQSNTRPPAADSPSGGTANLSGSPGSIIYLRRAAAANSAVSGGSGSGPGSPVSPSALPPVVTSAGSSGPCPFSPTRRGRGDAPIAWPTSRPWSPSPGPGSRQRQRERDGRGRYTKKKKTVIG